MLSEGWDAKTVTHIMGLRAFSSQLLCEQVVGRGLRRTSYEAKKVPHPVTGAEVELFEAEYVNIFGIPFTFLPHEGRKRAAAAAAAEDPYRGVAGESWLPDQLAERHPHRPRLPA